MSHRYVYNTKILLICVETFAIDGNAVKAENSIPGLVNDLSNELFENLEMTQNESNQGSLSPTAAFLLSFPVVSASGGKNAEVESSLTSSNLISGTTLNLYNSPPNDLIDSISSLFDEAPVNRGTNNIHSCHNSSPINKKSPKVHSKTASVNITTNNAASNKDDETTRLTQSSTTNNTEILKTTKVNNRIKMEPPLNDTKAYPSESSNQSGFKVDPIHSVTVAPFTFSLDSNSITPSIAIPKPQLNFNSSLSLSIVNTTNCFYESLSSIGAISNNSGNAIAANVASTAHYTLPRLSQNTDTNSYMPQPLSFSFTLTTPTTSNATATTVITSAGMSSSILNSAAVSSTAPSTVAQTFPLPPLSTMPYHHRLPHTTTESTNFSFALTPSISTGPMASTQKHIISNDTISSYNSFGFDAPINFPSLIHHPFEYPLDENKKKVPDIVGYDKKKYNKTTNDQFANDGHDLKRTKQTENHYHHQLNAEFIGNSDKMTNVSKIFKSNKQQHVNWMTSTTNDSKLTHTGSNNYYLSHPYSLQREETLPWSPSRIMEPVNFMPTPILPNLHGDLALNTEKINVYADVNIQSYQRKGSDYCGNKREYISQHNPINYYHNLQTTGPPPIPPLASKPYGSTSSNNSFLSVTQLVDQERNEKQYSNASNFRRPSLSSSIKLKPSITSNFEASYVYNEPFSNYSAEALIAQNKTSFVHEKKLKTSLSFMSSSSSHIDAHTPQNTLGDYPNDIFNPLYPQTNGIASSETDNFSIYSTYESGLAGGMPSQSSNNQQNAYVKSSNHSSQYPVSTGPSTSTFQHSNGKPLCYNYASANTNTANVNLAPATQHRSESVFRMDHKKASHNQSNGNVASAISNNNSAITNFNLSTICPEINNDTNEYMSIQKDYAA